MKTLIEHLDFALTVDANDSVLRDASLVVDGDRIEVGLGTDGVSAATIDGARALLWDHEVGSLEASSASIAETWVNGVAAYRDGAVQGVDEKALRAESRRRAAQAVRRAGLDDSSVPIKTTLYD